MAFAAPAKTKMKQCRHCSFPGREKNGFRGRGACHRPFRYWGDEMSRFRKEILFFCDAVIFAAAVAFFLLVYTVFDYAKGGEANGALTHIALLYACTVFFQLVFKTYDSLWRYAESQEYLSLLAAALCGFAAYEVITRLVLKSAMAFVLLLGIACAWVLGMLTVRFFYRGYRNRFLRRDRSTLIPVAILGAGEAGAQLVEELRRNPASRYRAECFFDDDRGKRGKMLHGVPVRGTLDEAAEKMLAIGLTDAIFAIPSLPEGERSRILRSLSEDGVHVMTLPGTLELIGKTPLPSQIREVQIEDLLGRDEVALDLAPVKALLRGRTVLVTGGGGSIGSELCRQIAKYAPKKLVIFDIYENNAYDIQQELKFQYGADLDLAVEIGSIRDPERLMRLMDTYRPDVVFHAAAHKHVPLMENCPQEAVRNNVFGTLNLVRAADAYGVQKFIQISTDKAVNPTNIMGVSKRVCEMIVQSMAQCSNTTFAAVRFGNVLGSNGSVIPLFKRQIAAGGPVTVTDARIIRYFMTIPEAASLVLEAGAMARQNELFVLNMGKPVKILDLAENLIRLSGYEPYVDINIVETGLRPGEKLYEELLIAGNNTEKTANDKIYVEHQPLITPAELEQKLDILRAALETEDADTLRSALHRVVPTFREPEEVNASQGAAVTVSPPDGEEAPAPACAE